MALMNSLNGLPSFNNQFTLNPQSRQSSSPKRKVLVWSDAVTATTGFGVVSKHILRALHDTGKYQIDQLAINMFEEFADRDMYPYNLHAARLGDPKDPYGNQMFLDILVKYEYDLVFVINDTFVTEGVSHKLEEVRAAKRQAGHKEFKLIYYYPVDCRFMPRATNMAKQADIAVAYTEFAKESTQRLCPEIEPRVIYHGSDNVNFKPVLQVDKTMARDRFFGVKDPDKFVLINVNRNNIRKDLARTLLAFKEFRKQVPNSILYMHTKILDSPGHGQEIDLGVPVEELGLNMQTDVIFPQNLHPAKGFPIDILNVLMNASDAYFTTTLGEGWGLTITEAMSAGLPVIAPRNTSVPEILGADLERGYQYPCREQVYVDNSGYRWCGRTEDIVATMMECYNDWKGNKQCQRDIIERAHMFTRQYSWPNVCKQWVDLFEEAYVSRAVRPEVGGEVL